MIPIARSDKPHPLPPMPVEPSIVVDRLYSLAYRPQELAMYGDQVTFALRSAAMFDDPAEITDTHFRLLVLEITAHPPGAQPVSVLKCGWELELKTPQPVQVGTLSERMSDVRLLVERIANTTADLARRAGVEPPLTAELITSLVSKYQMAETG